jgi:hypothetical protein
MISTLLRAASVVSVSALAVACSSAPSSSSTAQDDALSTDSSSAWLDLVDPCVQAGIGAGAKAALTGNFEHLYGFNVDDGDLAVTNALDMTVTTGNDEDGNTDHKVSVAETVDDNTGGITCKVTAIDGAEPPSGSTKSDFEEITDSCTRTAIVAAQKLSDNYWHLYGLQVDGDLASTNLIKYTVTGGNDEDGPTDYLVDVQMTADEDTGKITCKVTSSEISGGQ